MQSLFLVISNSLVVIAAVAYIISILKGRAKPHRTTRFVLLIIISLTTASLLAQKNYIGAWLPGISVVTSSLFFLLSLKFGMGGWARRDLLCLAIAFAGIALWQITSNPIVALYASIGADFMGLLPTILKTYHLPHTESLLFFLLNGLAGFFNLLATKNWVIQNFSYPLYICLVCSILVFLILRPKFSAQ